MEASSEGFLFGWDAIDESYRCLPLLYLGFMAIWSLSAFSWTFNTWRNRHFQLNNLQWILASVPLTKALQLGLSFLFWYSCFNLEICSLWMSFGVYVTGVLFQTAYFVSFLLISYGYCIMCERLSVPERRTTAALGCVLYLTLVGYKAAVPYFTVVLLLNYFISFYVIFRHIAQNLLVLSEQLSFIEESDLAAISADCFALFRKFQGAMQILAVAEIVMYMNMDDAADDYWFRLLVREWAQFCIFLYIGWIFRSKEVSPRFFVMPTVKSKRKRAPPPVYSLEIDAADFKSLASQTLQVGVPTSFPSANQSNSADSVLVIVQHPCSLNRTNMENPSAPKSSVAAAITDSYSDAGNRVNFID